MIFLIAKYKVYKNLPGFISEDVNTLLVPWLPAGFLITDLIVFILTFLIIGLILLEFLLGNHSQSGYGIFRGRIGWGIGQVKLEKVMCCQFAVNGCT